MTFQYAGETFTVLRRGKGSWRGYLVCRTWLGICLFRDDRAIAKAIQQGSWA